MQHLYRRQKRPAGLNPSSDEVPVSAQTLTRDNQRFGATGGISSRNRHMGFRSAFRDRRTGKAFLSRFADGSPSPVHLVDGLRAELIEARDAAGEVVVASSLVEAGFLGNGAPVGAPFPAASSTDSLLDERCEHGFLEPPALVQFEISGVFELALFVGTDNDVIAEDCQQIADLLSDAVLRDRFIPMRARVAPQTEEGCVGEFRKMVLGRRTWIFLDTDAGGAHLRSLSSNETIP